MSSHDPPLALDCYVRGGTPPASTRALVERMRALETGPVRDVDVHAWPPAISLSGSPNERELNVYETFAGWATDREVSLRPAFGIRDVTSLITGESTRELVTPVLSVGVYTARELVGVFPHTTEAGTYTVEDLVSGLERGAAVADVSPVVEPPTDRPRDSEDETPDAGTVPDVPELR